MDEPPITRRGDEMHLSESPEIRWFEAFPKCRCGKMAAGLLRGTQNQSYGYHCKSCADKRIKASAAVRAALASARRG